MILRKIEGARSDDVEAGVAVEVGDQHDRPGKPFSSRGFHGEPYLNVRVEIYRHDILIGEREGEDSGGGRSPCSGINAVAGAYIAAKTVIQQGNCLAGGRDRDRYIAVRSGTVDVQGGKRDRSPEVAVNDETLGLCAGENRGIGAGQRSKKVEPSSSHRLAERTHDVAARENPILHGTPIYAGIEGMDQSNRARYMRRGHGRSAERCISAQAKIQSNRAQDIFARRAEMYRVLPVVGKRRQGVDVIRRCDADDVRYVE